MTNIEYIERIKENYGDKYDYSKVNYTGSHCRITLICKKHGEFNSDSYSLLAGHECFKCSYENRNKKLSQEYVIEKLQKLHPEYDFSNIEYKGYNSPLNISCEEHGEFQTTFRNLFLGHKCKKCSVKRGTEKRTLTTQEFIERVKNKIGDKYEYSHIEYKNNSTYIVVGCNIHGLFNIKPYKLLEGGGCQLCSRGILNKEIFIERGKSLFGDKYDYSEVEYKDNNTKVNVICKIHGVFQIRPYDHLRGKGCVECSKKWNTESVKEYISSQYNYDVSKVNYVNYTTPITLICKKHGEFNISFNSLKRGVRCELCKETKNGMTTETFIERVKQKYSEYNYSKVEYKDLQTHITVICKKHGEFKIRPCKLLYRHGCPKCGQDKRVDRYKITQEQFIEKVQEKLPQYNYTKVRYIDYQTHVTVICNKHGEFNSSPLNLLQGKGCRVCGYERVGDARRISQEDFIERVKKVHPEYDYSKTDYNNCEDKVIVICKKHGEFKIRPAHLIRGVGCKKCGFERISKSLIYTVEEFIEKVKKIHPEYDYSKVDYKGNTKKVIIGCNKHGIFRATPNSLMAGSGCPICKLPKGELYIRKWLIKKGIEYESQKKFKDLGKLSYDFHIPNKKVLIEFNGRQHYEFVSFFHPNGLMDLRIQFRNDIMKELYAKEKGYKLVIIPYWRIKEIDKILDSEI